MYTIKSSVQFIDTPGDTVFDHHRSHTYDSENSSQLLTLFGPCLLRRRGGTALPF